MGFVESFNAFLHSKYLYLDATYLTSAYFAKHLKASGKGFQFV